MIEEVKRFVVDIQGREARECVFAAEHDRIVAALTEGGMRMQAERDQLRHLLIEAVVELKELKESVGYRAHTIGVIQRIDAALEASR